MVERGLVLPTTDPPGSTGKSVTNLSGPGACDKCLTGVSSRPPMCYPALEMSLPHPGLSFLL